jgi:hypothetical protein
MHISLLGNRPPSFEDAPCSMTEKGPNLIVDSAWGGSALKWSACWIQKTEGYQRWRAKKSRVRDHASSVAASLYIDGASQLLNAWPAA